MSIPHKSQSALEYMMTYGWAILVIVIVAGVLYSLGIFSPASSLSSTVTGFSNLGSVTGECTSNGILRISLGDSTGYPINITSITTKSSTGQVSAFTPNSTVDPSPIIQPASSYIFSIPNICPVAGSRYSLAVTVNYTEPGQVFPGPYQTAGSLSGVVSSTNSSLFVAEFNGAFTSYGTTNPLLSTINVNWVANQNYSISLWVNLNSVVANQVFVYITNQGTMSPLGLLSGNFVGSVWSLPDVVDSSKTLTGTWYNVILSYNKTTGNNTLYVNGIRVGTTTGTIGFPGQGVSEILTLGYPDSGPNCIFSSSCEPDSGMSTISGLVSNFQFYNSALTTAQASKIYTEGLLGKPVPSASLFLWWPLNGTAKDYSGNGNNGVSSNVIYTSNYQT